MLPILPSGNVPSTNVDGSHGQDDPANMPAATFTYVTPTEQTNPQNLNYMPWRMPGCPGGSDSY